MPRPDAPPSRDDPRATASKTQRKGEMHALQDLGIALVALDRERLATLDLPERLADAIALARTLKPHEARRRQMQFIGRLMRDIDPAPVRAALAAWEAGPRRERARFASLERWRDRLLDEPGALRAFIDAYPGAPGDSLAALVEAVRDERARSAPPAKARLLFRELKRIVERADAHA